MAVTHRKRRVSQHASRQQAAAHYESRCRNASRRRSVGRIRRTASWQRNAWLRAYRASRARIVLCIDTRKRRLRQGGAMQPSSCLWRFQSSLLCAAQQ
jgi:hypothetical protein